MCEQEDLFPRNPLTLTLRQAFTIGSCRNCQEVINGNDCITGG
jgi:hypothetical protein